MGDLEVDTAVRPCGEGRFEATLSSDWEIWGPMGGYVAACALRAAGAATEHTRPASFSCHYLRVAEFGTVDIRVERASGAGPRRRSGSRSARVAAPSSTRASGRSATTRVSSTTRPTRPTCPTPTAFRPSGSCYPKTHRRRFPFWRNLDAKPIEFEVDWPPSGPRPARWREWLRFLPTATFDDPWADAARCVILVDLPSWPSAHRPHAWTQPQFTAPTLDLNVAFHRPTTGQPWLLCDGAAPLSTAGLFGWNARRLVSGRTAPCFGRRTVPVPPASFGPLAAASRREQVDARELEPRRCLVRLHRAEQPVPQLTRRIVGQRREQVRHRPGERGSP